jgi:hypothetical protein
MPLAAGRASIRPHGRESAVDVTRIRVATTLVSRRRFFATIASFHASTKAEKTKQFSLEEVLVYCAGSQGPTAVGL